ncbi:MAG: glycosyltransferase [Pseudomonadota bacterium]|nr:glycosyltransferase [Pseudomonadota bacterium]
MKLLIIAVGSRGDVQPFVAFGRAARAAGHEVVLSAPQGFDGMIEAAGLTAAALAVDFQDLLQKPEMQAAFNSLTGRLKAFRWANEIMNDQLSEIWRIGLDVAPDLILYHFKGAMGPYLGRRLGVPAVPVALQPGFAATGEYPMFLMGSKDRGALLNRMTHRIIHATMRMGTNVMVKRWIKATGADVGPLMEVREGYSPTGTPTRLHAFSPALVPRPKDWEPRDVQPGYFFEAPDEAYAPDPALAAFLADGPKPIYAGFGSMPGLDHARTTTALRGALEKTGQRAVLATGWGGIEGFETGENIHVLDAVPHMWLFPRVSAVIHHGGSGTTHEGLRWGRPSVVCPLFADQPFFGARVAALGAGPAPIRQKHLTAENLAAAIDVALRPETAERAGALGVRIWAETGMAETLALIERLA